MVRAPPFPPLLYPPSQCMEGPLLHHGIGSWRGFPKILRRNLRRPGWTSAMRLASSDRSRCNPVGSRTATSRDWISSPASKSRSGSPVSRSDRSPSSTSGLDCRLCGHGHVVIDGNPAEGQTARQRPSSAGRWTPGRVMPDRSRLPIARGRTVIGHRSRAERRAGRGCSGPRGCQMDQVRVASVLACLLVWDRRACQPLAGAGQEMPPSRRYVRSDIVEFSRETTE